MALVSVERGRDLIMESVKVTNALPGGAVPGEASWVGRFLSGVAPLTWETVLLFFLAAAGLISRLWALGVRVMSHDESLHVFYSWQLASGKGFVHDPMMHGPFIFEATALINVLLGANDFTSRLVPALLGVFIVVGFPQLLKPWLGWTGALVASVFLLISPFVLYFSRYIRHDILVISWTLLAILAIFNYLATRKERDLILLAAALALMLSTMEIAYIYLAILAGFLALSAIVNYRFSWKLLRTSAEFDLLIVLTTLGAFFSSPIALLVLNPIWTRLTGAPFVDLAVLDTRGVSWSVGASGIRLWGLFALFSIAAVIIGLRWNWKRWLMLAAVFVTITVLLFTTFFTNPAGIGTGFIGSLGYWLSQQGVARGSQPWYYYLIVFPIYEYLPLVGGLLAAGAYFVRQRLLSDFQRTFVAFLIWWAGGIFVALSLAGEKMPWLSTHIAIPFILLTAWWTGQLLERGRFPGKGLRIQLQRISRWLSLGLVGLLAVLTVRTSFAVNYVNYDYSTEWIDYAHGAPGVKWVLDDIAAIANHTGAGQDLKIAFDDEVSWPMSWYLRNFPNQVLFGNQPNRQALDAPVVIAGPKNWAGVEAILGNRYHRFELIRLWWPLEDYRGLTWERIRNAITDPAMRAALWDIFWNRDFRKYAAITGQDLNPPASWPLAERMRVYVRKDIASQMLSLSIGPNMLEDLPAPADAYLTVHRSVTASQLIENEGFNAPRGLAIAPDG
ncbi:MAG: TIGR03663 family protein, partial [Kiritimatiellota bacterium]|nr:TIGR03663 family protein [Kiritimatiellota bacterium]